MGNLFRSAALFASLLGFCACAPVRGFPEADTASAQTTALRSQYAAALNADTVDKEKLRRLRNAYAYSRIDDNEDTYTAFATRLWGENNALSLGGSLAILALGGLGATTGHGPTASALAAASAGVVGAQGAISKDLYFERTLPAILAQISANRAQKKAEIYAALGRLSVDEYPIEAVDIHIRELYLASGMPAAIQVITTTATANKLDANDAVQDMLLKRSELVPPAPHAMATRITAATVLAINAGDKATLSTMADALGVAPTDDLKLMAANIRRKAAQLEQSQDGASRLSAAFQKLKDAGVKGIS